jgi:hypothetical protein
MEKARKAQDSARGKTQEKEGICIVYQARYQPGRELSLTVDPAITNRVPEREGVVELVNFATK